MKKKKTKIELSINNQHFLDWKQNSHKQMQNNEDNRSRQRNRKKQKKFKPKLFERQIIDDK